ncbi:BRO family protein [Anaeromicrobium sediminis]|uniref:Bro-N domain-containing protein n=1 Tax=Anaeromicrobium sediminis TaxID=1478221 RepID=A0A267MNC3_9FIRM|nr:BRO family protein [Anaeromicrobium sediminis]PAB61111.1 hypothetical protein CCE28_01395 [Anaeromicrobium sediminis]
MIWNDKEVWFHASDVGKVLDLVNKRKVLPNIRDKYKRKFKDSDVTKGYNRNSDTHLNNRGEILIEEI